MRKQQKIRQEEHRTALLLPSLSGVEPSSAVEYFVEFLKSEEIISGKVLDIGCGKGRNSVYLVKLGFEVWGMDYIQEALDTAKELAAKNQVKERISFLNHPIDEPWPFADGFFNFAVDCFSSIDIETQEGREIYRSELYRTLKVGGLAFVA